MTLDTGQSWNIVEQFASSGLHAIVDSAELHGVTALRGQDVFVHRDVQHGPQRGRRRGVRLLLPLAAQPQRLGRGRRLGRRRAALPRQAQARAQARAQGERCRAQGRAQGGEDPRGPRGLEGKPCGGRAGEEGLERPLRHKGRPGRVISDCHFAV